MNWDAARAAAFFDEYGEREWTRFEDRTPAPSLEVHVEILRRFVRAGDRVLDAGCGPGRFTLELQRIGADVVALDISPGQLDLLRQRAGDVDAVLGDITDLSRFDEGSFDAVVCFGGPLSYVVERADAALAELVRVTRPGGHVLLSVMSLAGTVVHYLPQLLDLARRDGVEKQDEIVRTGFLPDEPEYGHLAMKLYRWSELEAMLARHGTIELAAAAGLLPAAEAEEPELRAFLSRVELELAFAPGTVGCGEHMVAVLRRPA
jgi:SAM-dependent methyltransferase